jgi:hypothetical protein
LFRAVEMITRHFGSVAAMTIKNMDIEKFPMLALVYRLRGTTEIFQVKNQGSPAEGEGSVQLTSSY